MLRAVLRRALDPLAPPSCLGCGASAGQAGPLCPACRSQLGWLPPGAVALARAGEVPVEAWAPVAYRGGASALVRALKFRGAVAVAELMAAQIVAGWPEGLVEGAELVPVPLPAARRRRRGFNQAERIARAVARRTGAEVSDCLQRTGRHGTQVGRDREQRLAALCGAVAVRAGHTAPREAVVVDDVITTGATILACAWALRTAGCERVAALAYARTPGR